MNKMILTGRICNDIEMRYTNYNKEVVNINLAVKRDRENTDFISVTAFGGTAKLVSDYCKKGDRILIDGKLCVNNYTDKEGNKKTAYSVLAHSIEFLENKKHTGEKDTQAGTQAGTQADIYSDFGKQIEIYDSTIPDDDNLPF